MAEASAVIAKRKHLATTDFYHNKISELSIQISQQQKLSEGLGEVAQKQNLINELKRKGLAYDDAAVQKIIQLQKQLGSEKLKNENKKKIETLYDQALRAAGRKQYADEQQAIRQAQNVKGSILTDAEKEMTLKLLTLNRELSNLPMVSNSDFRDFTIRTNALTARGGFMSGVKVPDISQYQKQMVTNGNKSIALVQKIEAMLREIIGE